MRVRGIAVLLLFQTGALPALADPAHLPAAAVEKLESEVELTLERVVPLSRFEGQATVTDNDPRYVVA